MTKEEARTKVYFKCSCCGKEKWTLKMNFKDGQKCSSCKRKEKIGDFLNSDEFKQKRKETLIKKYGSLENSKKVMAEKSKQAKLLKNNGSYFSDESKDKISNSLKNKSAEEKEKIISQGYSPAAIRLGLYYNDELVEIEGFSKPRFSNKYDYELIRECSKNGYNIFGGKSKILKFFKQKYNPKSILSYCEKDKFSGISYFKNGFILDHESKPNYVYYKDSFNGESRLKFQKSKLANILANYDPSLTEWENMERNGYLRLFDYGQYIFVWYV